MTNKKMDNANGSCDKGVVNIKERINSKGTENETNFKEHRDAAVKNAATNSQQVSSKRSLDDNDEALDDDDDDTKRRKLTGDERLKRNRERNRMHARKTRERKKKQSFALQQRISELKIESNLLRQMIDERFTACALLGLSQQTNQDGESIPIMSSATICKKSALNHNASDVADNMNSENASPIRRARRRGKYSPQERERIRRERNRMHAKRTRDKKKLFLEASEQIIYEMETESRLLREYLVSVKLISVEDSAQSEQRTIQSKKELALLKAYSLQHDGNDDDEQDDDDDDADDDEDDDEHDQDQANNQDLSNYDDNDDGDDEQGYHSGSDEKGSWGGSNDGSNHDSTNGETSADGDNSGSDKGRRTSSSLSNVSSTSIQFERTQSSTSTSRDGSTGSDNGNSGDNGDNGSDNGNSGDNGSGSNSSDDQPN